jgi:hypothetical protein
MVFLSGQVRMHSATATYPPERTLSMKGRVTRGQHLSSNPSIFRCCQSGGSTAPAPAQHDSTAVQDVEPASLVLKSTIHSSENTLRPSLLPFMTDLVNRAEHRMRKASSSSSSASTRTLCFHYLLVRFLQTTPQLPRACRSPLLCA